MSFQIASATDHIDLLDRVRNFAENLISPAGERWTVERYTGIQDFVRSSELGTYEAFLAFTDNPNEDWRTALGQATPSHIGVDLIGPVDITRVVVQGVNSIQANDLAALPDLFALEYSDNGSAWTELDSFAAGPWTAASQRKVFDVGSPSQGAHRFWRLNIATNNGNTDWTSITRLELYTDDGFGSFYNEAEEAQLIMRGPGLPQDQEIYVGMQVYTRPSSDIYNWRVAAFTGYVPGLPFSSQPGGFGTPAGYPLWNLATPYWLVANGQRIVLVSKVETTYQTLYLGKALPYATPGQWPYPVTVASMLPTDTLTRYSEPSIIGPWQAASAQLRMRLPGGAWIQPECYPWVAQPEIRDAFGGGYQVVPVILTDADGVYAELDGVAHVSGFGNAVENIVQDGGTDYLVVHDVFRSGIRDYHAVRLE